MKIMYKVSSENDGRLNEYILRQWFYENGGLSK